MVSPVLFSQTIQNLLNHSATMRKRRRDNDKPFVDLLMEVGPHSALQGPLKQILETNSAKFANISYISMLSRGKDANISALEAVGRLFTKGYPVNVVKVNSPTVDSQQPMMLVDLPPYSWNRVARYWFESHLSHNYRFRKHPRHDLFGALTAESSLMEPRWRNFLRLSENPWIQHHRVGRSDPCRFSP